MRLWLGALMTFLLLSVSAFAAPAPVSSSRSEVQTSFEFYPLNYQARFERTETQDYQSRQALNLAVGGSRGVWGLLFEYSRFNSVSGTDYSSLVRNHEETLLWLRREVTPLRSMFLSFAAGAGFSRETVETRFGDDSVTDQGRAETLGAVSVGTGFEMKKTLRLSLEGRLFYGSSEPNPQPDLVIRTGFRF